MLADFDIYAYLVSQQDMVFFDDDAETAADQMNEMLHYVATYMEEDDSLEQLEEVIRRALFEWIENDELLEIDSDDMQTYILEQLADIRQQELDDHE
jgi:L-asparaginase/Glu-tRNA(Gln) amidotransferase subunit D